MMQSSNMNVYTFASLFLVLIIDAMGFGLVMPILPPLFLDNQIGLLHPDVSAQFKDFIYGLTMAVFFIFTFWGSTFIGDLSDQLGRKKVLFLCLLGVALGYLISAFGILSKSIFFLIFGRAVSGFSAGSQLIAQAAIVDISTEKNRTFNIGLMNLASCLGFVIGPVVGGYFSNIIPSGLLAYSLPFFVAGLLAVTNAIALQFTFRETYVPSAPRKFDIAKAFTTFKMVRKLKQLRVLSLIYTLVQLGWSICFQFTALYLAEVFVFTSNQIGLFMGYLGVVFGIAFFLINRVLLQLLKIFQLIVLCILLAIAGLISILLFKSELSFWLNMAPISIGIALSYSTLISVFSSRVDKDSQGMVMGITGALGSVAWVIGGLSMGVLTKFGPNFPFIITIVIFSLSICLLLWDFKRYKY